MRGRKSNDLLPAAGGEKFSGHPLYALIFMFLAFHDRDRLSTAHRPGTREDSGWAGGGKSADDGGNSRGDDGGRGGGEGSSEAATVWRAEEEAEAAEAVAVALWWRWATAVTAAAQE